MYELMRIKSACEATLVADDYVFLTQLRCIAKAITTYEQIYRHLYPERYV